VVRKGWRQEGENGSSCGWRDYSARCGQTAWKVPDMTGQDKTQPDELDNDAIGAAIADAIERANFGLDLKRQGVTTVAIDEGGRLVEHRPDGTTTLLS
jgi:hypothetical protein